MVKVATPVRQVVLELSKPNKKDKAARDSLSAVALTGETMWLANDEGTGVDQLTRSAAGDYTKHRAFPLLDLLCMPLRGDDAQELDIEGLDVDGEKLWLVGSHTWTRGNPEKAAKKGGDVWQALADVDPNPNRHVLACLPLLHDGKGYAIPAAESGAKYPMLPDIARLHIGNKRGALIKALAGDEHLDRFLDLPAKENGVDIEGLVVRGERVFLGLRGPVLRGYAMILELRIQAEGKGKLGLQPLGENGRSYRKHVLHLGGNGIRDLFRHGDDLLILAGPTANIDGRCYVWCWRNALGVSEPTFIPEPKKPDGEGSLRRILQLPVGDGGDHPEGMALLPGSDDCELLVVYDAPLDHRKGVDGGGVHADVFSLPA